MAQFTQPISRDEFHVGIVCALPSEADAVMLLFDQFWDEDGDPFGRSSGDNNSYTTGRLGKYNVVLLTLPDMGTNSAASATANLRSSYGSLRLVFLVGICGGVPKIAGDDVFLGDVVVSKAIVQYDFGRQFPGHYEVKDTLEDSLGRANKEIRGMLAALQTERMREMVQNKSAVYLKQLQSADAKAAAKKRRRSKYRYPGITEDKLYLPRYVHRHLKQCGICSEFDSTCDLAAKTSCTDLGCDDNMLVQRDIFEDDGDFSPNIFIGRIGSSNTVMKSGKIRDYNATKFDLIAFEMEGAGAWDEVPCLVVKGVCDYADSHKNNLWQNFAAATAASVMKAILDRYIVTDAVQRPAAAQVNGGNGQGGGNSTRSISGNTFGDNVRIVQGDMTWNGN
ncbi:uncharacterized protein TrAtP1_009631 [Trichoderma atroviride]|uniref:Nucleoside phosphorylase domain-containing protein n=1 Tax=Hypocrea atroviridis (strain ATCC 20476 / IMI 206040) TaxID=452589 RepID=G9NL27_HYPAI|nr:uncharacterized protein TRIATDRAFT_145443 [Trichoderma atroviride IMI 206040]EHK48595.1 hypothetical protein TRIATDRAFT_145443 [Trichoderma atroviride IMI 206040]UKZ68606.1 hypothetical protein TrAtP1_009631 [Trichoderma atroviride]